MLARRFLRRCWDCGDAKNFIVHGKHTTYCRLQEKFRNQESKCNLGYEESTTHEDDNEIAVHEESCSENLKEG